MLGVQVYGNLALLAALETGLVIVDCFNILGAAGGIEKAIAARVQLFSRDTDLLHSLIYEGRPEVYIDGYSEVNPETQEEIPSFTAAFSNACILIRLLPEPASDVPVVSVCGLEGIVG